MGSLNFITSNPASAAFNSAMDSEDRRRNADDQAMRSRYAFEEGIRQGNAMNEAANSVQSLFGTGAQPGQPVPASPDTVAGPSQPTTALAAVSAPSVRQADILAAIPQNKYTAATRMQLAQNIASQNAATAKTADDHVFDLIKAGGPANLAMARQLAQQSGIQIPDSFWNDAKAQARLMGLVDAAHKMGLRGDQIPAYFSNLRKGGADLPPEAAAAADIKPGLAWKTGTGGAGGHANSVQRTFSSNGQMWAVMKDGTTKQLTDQNGQPLRASDVDKFAGQLYIKGLGGFEPVTMDQAQATAGSLYPGAPAPQGAKPAPSGLPPDARQIGTKGGKAVYEFIDPTTNQRRRVVAQ